MTGPSTQGNTLNNGNEGQPAWLLRIYLLACDRFEGEPLTEALLLAARQAGIRGATVLPGIAGFGESGRHGELEIRLHDPLRQPVVVEVADTGERLQRFLPTLQRMNMAGRLTTLEKLSVLSYHSNAQQSEDAAG